MRFGSLESTSNHWERFIMTCCLVHDQAQAFAFLLFSWMEPSLRAAWASFSLPSAKRAAACKYDAICQNGDIIWAWEASLRASCGMSFIRYDRLRRAKTVGETIVPTSINCTARQTVNLDFQASQTKIEYWYFHRNGISVNIFHSRVYCSQDILSRTIIILLYNPVYAK